MENVIVYYGKGEYALTGKNIIRLTKTVVDYNNNNIWKWQLQDVLGIKGDGKLGVRFNLIKTELAKLDDNLAKGLLAEMEKVVIKDINNLIKNPKLTNEEIIKLRKDELKLKLADSGLTEEQMETIVAKLA